MNTENKTRLALVCVTITGVTNPADFYVMAESQFQGFGPKQFVKINANTFLVNVDECYPGIIKLISYCNQTKDVPGQPCASVLIAELSESALILSPQLQNVKEIARETGHWVRVTKS